jgi:hypothetical protein
VEAGSSLIERIDQLLALFHRRSEDVPDGLFDRRTQFVLNGVSFEERLGRSPTDPLVLMLTRGPSGYRFTLKSIQHAIPGARIERGDIQLTEATAVHCQCRLSGHLRGTGEGIDAVIAVRLELTAVEVVQCAQATLGESDLHRIREARMRP